MRDSQTGIEMPSPQQTAGGAWAKLLTRRTLTPHFPRTPNKSLSRVTISPYEMISQALAQYLLYIKAFNTGGIGGETPITSTVKKLSTLATYFHREFLPQHDASLTASIFVDLLRFLEIGSCEATW